MRIEGMDASAFNNQRTVEVKNDTIANNNSQTVNFGVENKNISQITDFEKKDMPISERFVIEAIERANKAIVGSSRRFEFSIHEATKEIMVKVIDSETNEVIRQIPNEKILDMVAKMWEMAGLMVDERR